MFRGVIRNGQVETVDPIDLPDGTEVTITVIDDVPPSPVEIARVLAAMERIEPLSGATEESDEFEVRPQHVVQTGDQ